MASEITVTLSGSESEARFSGANAWLRNDGAATVYAAKTAGVTAGADGVVAVPAGGSAPVYGANGRVFLLGTGSVQLIGSDYSTNPFKTSAQAGGSGVDDVARAAVTAHAGNSALHVSDDVLQYKGYLNSGSLLDHALAMTGSGYLLVGTNTTDTPADGQFYFVEVRKHSGGSCAVVAIRFNAGGVFTNRYNSNPNMQKWYGWSNAADGGCAASVGAYTEAKIAALEARIAALEGGT